MLLRTFFIFAIAAAAASFASGCFLLERAVDFRTIDSVLSEYESTADPKPVSKFLFRSGRSAPEADELLTLAHWSLEHRVPFIRLLDKLEGEWKSSFVDSFAQALRSSDLREAFQSEFGSTKAPTVRRILSRL